MTTAWASRSSTRTKAATAVIIGGFTAGLFDLISAFVIYGPLVPRVIAGGLLGSSAHNGGIAVYTLGVLLQFFIALCAAGIYFVVSRKLDFLTEHAFVCGLFYGIAVFLVMNLIVLPLSALHNTGPFRLERLIQGLLVHMICIGLPISYSVRWFARSSTRGALTASTERVL